MSIYILQRFFFLFLALTLFLFIPSSVLAQETTATAQKYGFTFPIAELGNCTDMATCKAYCQDETHKDACVVFAKKKGFYKASPKETKQSSLLQSSKAELGCTSEISCRALCEQEANREKCLAFAEKNGLDAPRGPANRTILEKAKTILGCDSEQSCKAICGKVENQEKCSSFAEQAGLSGGIRRVGPGGCNSEESCRSYCQSHQEECAKFGGAAPAGEDQNRRGPGGCTSEESCKAYCEQHPSECQGESGPQEQRKHFCNENPDKCSGQESPAQSPEAYCQQNPDKCRLPEEASRRHGDSFNKRPPSAGEFERSYNDYSPAIQEQQTRQTNQPVDSSLQEEPISQDVQGDQTQQSLLQTLKSWFFRF